MNDENQDLLQESQTDATAPSGLWIRLTIAGLFLTGVIYLSQTFTSQEILNFLAQQESRAVEYRQQHPVAVYGVAFLIYVAVTGLSLPGAAVLTILYGWFFDFLPALALVSFASTTGATLAFLMSRYLLRDSIQNQFGDRLQTIHDQLNREGAWYLFTLRLIPAIPFFVINLVMGLTPVSVGTFWWVSQLGMLPGTAVFTYAGSSFPEISAIQAVVSEHGIGGLLTQSGSDLNLANLFVALVVLGLFPVLLKFLMNRFRKTSAEFSETETSN